MKRCFSLLFFLFLSGCKDPCNIPAADRSYAMDCVRKQCEIVPRYVGSEGAGKTAVLIKDLVKKISPDIPVEIDSFQDKISGEPVILRNVCATIQGKNNSKPVILAAHYDTKKLELSPDFQGANDGGSGVAVLLAVMKVLAEQKITFSFPIHFLFFDGEECRLSYSREDGLHGSRKAAKDYRGRARAMILADMVGDSDWHISIPENSDPELKKRALQAAADLNMKDFVTAGELTVLDDHVPFLEAGIPAIDLIDFEYGPGNVFWHTPSDTVDQIDPESLGKTADLILRILTLL